MSIIDSIFANHETKLAILRYPTTVVVNAQSTKPTPPAKVKTAECMYWSGSMAQRFISQQFLADCSGVVVFKPDDMAKTDIPDNSRIDVTEDTITGAVNHVGGYSTGALTMVVDGFTDSARTIRTFDTFTITGETGSIEHEVVSTVKTGGVTTSITFKPALASNIADDTVITMTPIIERLVAIKADDIALQGLAIIVPCKVYT
jgi:hypothetical protein